MSQYSRRPPTSPQRRRRSSTAAAATVRRRGRAATARAAAAPLGRRHRRHSTAVGGDAAQPGVALPHRAGDRSTTQVVVAAGRPRPVPAQSGQLRLRTGRRYVIFRPVIHHQQTVQFLSFRAFVYPTDGTGGIMFSACSSVCASVRTPTCLPSTCSFRNTHGCAIPVAVTHIANCSVYLNLHSYCEQCTILK